MEGMDKLALETDVFANLREWAPQELLRFLDQVVVLFPDQARYRLKQVVDSLPREGDNVHKVLELVRAQWRGLRSEEWVSVAVVGPAQTGKSTLVQAITGHQEDSTKPVFNIVEMPGLEEYLGDGEMEAVAEDLARAELIVMVLDAQYELSDATIRMYEAIAGFGKPILVVLNKIDAVESRSRALRRARKSLGAPVLGASGWDRRMLDPLLKAAVDLSPNTLSTLTQAFPQFRRSICGGLVSQSAFAAAITGAIPIPISDFVPLAAIQTGMLLKLARAYGFSLDRERAQELLPMLAAGIAVREGTNELRGRFPAYRRLISVSVAGLWTFLLGRSAIGYFDQWRSLLIGRSLPKDLPFPVDEAV